jgi:cellulose 1,4-beta-cellobiosidase
MRFATRQGKAVPVVLALVLLGAAGCGGQADEVTDSVPAAARVDNPFAGVKGYVNPEWRAKALAESGGDRVANNPTAVWLRDIASITGANGGTSLQKHLDTALAQGAGYIEVVLYDLPGRDCTSWSLNTELQSSELSIYQSQFVDPIAAIEADSKYGGLRIINVIEPKSLAYLVTNVSSSRCSNVQTSSDYVGGVQYALGKLGAIPNAYNYLDIAHHGVLGWEQNLTAAVALYVKTIQGASGGFGTVAGFVSNVANYSATVEPFFQASTMVNGTAVRQSKWVDWNNYVDEQSFDLAWKNALVSGGASSSIGMLIDTSRNGWGGSARPKAASTSTDLNTFVEQSRVDRRMRVDNWCNQSGAGLGERPQVVGANGIQAYVWIKPPGESDGASSVASDGKGFEPMCNPAYEVVPDGALPSAPIANAWFSSEFQELMANAYPPLDAVPSTDTTPPSAPTGLVASSVTTSTVTLSWSASTDNVAVVAYDVYSSSMLVASAKVTSTTVMGLTSGTTYSFTVRARDAAGNVSASSSALSTLTGCACDTMPPTVPTGLAYTSLNSTDVALFWTASTDNVGVTGYEILDGGVVVGSSKTIQFDVAGLLPGTSHTFTVRAFDAMGLRSSPSTPVTVTTALVPPGPDFLRWTASGGTVELCWDPPGVDAMSRFNLYYGSFNLGTFDGSCVALIGFKPGTPYTFTVKTVDELGNTSAPSNAVTVLLNVPVDTTPPTAPGFLVGTVLSSTSVRLAWSASTDAVGVVIYQIYSSGALIQTVAASTSATITGLTTGKAYTFTVKAVDAAGNVSSASNALTLTWTASDSTAPTNLRVTTATGQQAAILSWDPPASGGTVAGYEVHELNSLGDNVIERTTITSAVVYEYYGEFNALYVHTYYVKAIDAAGNLSSASGPIAITFRNMGDPYSQPAILQFKATATTSTTATLTWSPASNPCTVWYKVYSADVLMGLTSSTTATISNLTAGKSYTFTLKVMDSCALTAGSAGTVTVKPGATLDTIPPSTPTNLKVSTSTVQGGYVSGTFSWSASTDNVGVVAYDLYCKSPYSGSVYLETSVTTTTTSFTFDQLSLPTCTVRARDATGNVSSDSNSVTISTK